MARTKVHEQKNVDVPELRAPTQKPLMQAVVPAAKSGVVPGMAKFGFDIGSPAPRGPSRRIA